MIRGRAREGTSWDGTEVGTGRSHSWSSPLVTLLRWAEFELLTSKVLAPSMKSVIVTLQPLIIQALGGKWFNLCWTCFWATEYSVLRCNFASVAFYPTASSLTSADLENRAHLSSATFYKFEASSFSLLLSCLCVWALLLSPSFSPTSLPPIPWW